MRRQLLAVTVALFVAAGLLAVADWIAVGSRNRPAEYACKPAVMVALIAVVCLGSITRVQPGLGDDACAIRAKLQAGIAAVEPQAPPDPCATTTLPPNLTP